jgi:hypothetical protein
VSCNQTVDSGPNFSVADPIFDANFFYCRIEPMMVQQKCGAGDGGSESAASCHFSQTSFVLVDYSPLYSDSCRGGDVPSGSPPHAAQQNYERAQAKMNRDPNQAPLFLRPTGAATHPRVIFAANSPEANLIRQWATKFSTQ